MIVKDPRRLEMPRPTPTRIEVREALIEAWAQIFERELRAHLEDAALHEHAATQPEDHPARRSADASCSEGPRSSPGNFASGR